MGLAYSNFVDSLKSDDTRRMYKSRFGIFQRHLEIADPEEITKIPVTELQNKIIDFIPVEERDGEMFYSEIGLEKVRQFINECVQTYNETHFHKMDYESVAELVGSMREQDKKDFQRLVVFQENA